MQQSSRKLMLVIGDNCSTDNTRSIIEKFSNNPNVYSIHREVNIGGIANINDLLYNHCNTPYAVIMSDDDYYVDNEYLSNAVDILEKNPNIGFVHGEIEYDYNDGKITANSKRKVEAITKGHNFFMNFGNPQADYAYLMTVVFRTNLAKEVNFFFDKTIPHGDSLAWLKMSTKCDVGFIDRIVARYVMHGFNDITSPDIGRWLDDIKFINIAHRYALDQTDWDRDELSLWLKRQRRIYCGKILKMLRQEPTWMGYVKKISQLQMEHNIISDPELVKDAIKSFIFKAFKRSV
jgi:glycosyltransferase involved in cell wall biosynthesis